LTTNATSLATCGYLDLEITGGTKPYSVSFVGVDGDSSINEVMGPDDDEYIWVNQIDPSMSPQFIGESYFYYLKNHPRLNEDSLAVVSDA
jgi:hypothetical protein